MTATGSTPVYAHSREGSDPSGWQTLNEHLCNVADLASRFAAAFGYENWGRTLGLFHDAGKINPAFQRRLFGSKEPVDHGAPGAKAALSRYISALGDANGCLLAFPIAGHHGGMPNGLKSGDGERTPLGRRLSEDGVEDVVRAFLDYAECTGITFPDSSELEPMPLEKLALSGDIATAQTRGIFSASVFSRMLFSCLVDADYIDTERYMAPDVAAARGNVSKCQSIAELSNLLDRHMDGIMASAVQSMVNKTRAEVLEECRAAARGRRGIYTLTVPTGGGKTLFSLSFAFRHAAANGMDRVIYAIPYTSIVEQTARVFREVLGDVNVLEHHSNYDFDLIEDDEERLAARLAVQNWDAPLIVTTNVQLFESLFSNKPGKCRKLHNIANSVIVLDEAQTLPDGLLTVTLAMLEELAADYNVTVLLCTATQPALDGLWPFGTCPREIISCQDNLDTALGGRVRFEVDGGIRGDELVDALSTSHQVLCILGTKKKARVIFEDVVRRMGVAETDAAAEHGIFHLSANMTPLHRSEILDSVRRRLVSGNRCIVISTQLVEAGVDIDFPVVYREMAGADSLVQAAGRCNREGRLDQGIVHLFEISDEFENGLSSKRYDVSWLGRMKTISKRLIEAHGGAFDAAMSKEFFECRYGTATAAGLDVEGLYGDMVSSALLEARPVFGALDFERYADKYRIIEDDTVPVFVPWGEKGRLLLKELADACSRGVPAAAFAVKLQQSSVGVAPWRLAELVRAGVVDADTYAPIYVHAMQHDCQETYSNAIGLLEPEEGRPMTLVC